MSATAEAAQSGSQLKSKEDADVAGSGMRSRRWTRDAIVAEVERLGNRNLQDGVFVMQKE